MDIELLKKPLPPEAISKHPTKPYLSSIKAIYVTERFNEVFGVGKWTIKTEEVSVDKQSGMVVVKAIFEVPEEKIYYESFGGNDNGGTGNKNFDLGDAYKGATTDAITKIGSYLGVGIDVFKGMPQKATQAPYKQETQKKVSKPLMTEEQFKFAIKYLVNKKTIKIGTHQDIVMKHLEAQHEVPPKFMFLIEEEIAKASL